MTQKKKIPKKSTKDDILKFYSSKNSVNISVNSRIEYDCCYWLEYNPLVIAFESQPPSYTYYYDGKKHDYTPDFLVTYSDGSQQYIEIKSFSATQKSSFNSEDFKAKKETALIQHGIELILVTNRQLRSGLVLENCKLIKGKGGETEELNSYETITYKVAKSLKTPTISAIAEQVELSVNKVKSIVLRLLSFRLLFMDLTVKLSEKSIISSSPAICPEFIDEFENEHIFDSEENRKLDEINELRYQSLEESILTERDLHTYSKEDQKIVTSRYRLLEYIKQRISGGWTPKNLEPLIDEYTDLTGQKKVSYKTVKRWKDKYLETGGHLSSLVDRQHKKGNKQNRADGDEQYFQKAREQYLDAKSPSYKHAYKRYESLIDKHNLNPLNEKIKCISYIAFYKRLQRISDFECLEKRKGSEAAQSGYKYTNQAIKTTRILERVEIDHTKLDIVLLDDEHNVVINRPNLTLVVDVFSGCIVGFYLGYTPPSYDSVAKAMWHAMSDKSDIDLHFKDKLKNKYLCKGKIETLVVDCGSEFLSMDLEDACNRIEINIDQNKIRTPQGKPHVERAFRTINDEVLPYFQGRTFSSVAEKGDHDPEKNANATFSFFYEFFVRWIVDDYHIRANQKKTRIPNNSWVKSYESLPPREFDENDKSFLKRALGKVEQVSITTKGITFKYLQYDSNALQDYRKKYSTDGKNIPTVMKFDPDDISRVQVFLDNLGQYLTVPVKGDYNKYTHNLGFAVHLKILEKNKKEIEKSAKISAESLTETRLKMAEDVEALPDKIKSTNKRRKNSKDTKDLIKQVQQDSHDKFKGSNRNTVMPQELQEHIQRKGMENLENLWDEIDENE